MEQNCRKRGRLRYIMSANCCVCNKHLGGLSAKLKISDGAVCPDCLKAAGLGEVRHALAGADSYTAGDIRGLIALREQNAAAIDEFSPKETIRNLQIDRKNGLIRIKAPLKDAETANLIRFDQIAGFTLVEDHTVLASGGAEHPAEFPMPGPARFGAASTFLHIEVLLADNLPEGCEAARINVPFLSLYTKHSNIIYKQARLDAAQAMTALQAAYDQARAGKSTDTIPRSETTAASTPNNADAEVSAAVPESSAGFSAADEIRKFKSLLDDGIITEEEFQAKKKQLLNL